MSSFTDILTAKAAEHEKSKATTVATSPTKAGGTGDDEIKSMNLEAPLIDILIEDAGEPVYTEAGASWRGRCPICGHNDNLRWVREGNYWHCHSTYNTTGKEGGGYSDYLVAARGMTPAEAIAELRQLTGHPRKGIKSRPRQTRQGGQRQQGQFDHTEVAERLMEEYHVARVEGALVVWDSERKCYQMGREPLERAMISVRKQIKRSQRTEVLEYLMLQAPRVSMAEPRFIQFTNGVLDIDTMELFDSDPALIIPNLVPHRWNPSAYCHELDEAVEAWACGDEGRIANLDEIVGLCLYRGSEVTACPVLIGLGANGKSTFIDFLRDVIGRENVSALSLANVGRRFQSVELMGKLANIADDLPPAFVEGELMETVKKAITGNVIEAEYKGGSTFNFRPYAQFCFAANELPKLGDKTYGTYRRFIPIRFEAEFSAYDGTANTRLQSVLATEAAYERAIVRGVQALRRCVDCGHMTKTDDQDQLLEAMKRQNSSVVSFVHYELDDDVTRLYGKATEGVFNDYKAYCEDARLHSVSRNSFTTEVTSTYKLEVVRLRDEDGRQRRCFKPKAV